MRKSSKKKRVTSEDEIHEWLEKSDLRDVKAYFKKGTFRNIKPTDWDSLYDGGGKCTLCHCEPRRGEAIHLISKGDCFGLAASQ